MKDQLMAKKVRTKWQKFMRKFNPLLSSSVFKLIIAIIEQKDYHILKFDIKTADTYKKNYIRFLEDFKNSTKYIN